MDMNIKKIIKCQGWWWSTSCHRSLCVWTQASLPFLSSTCVSLRAFPSCSGPSITCEAARFGPCCCASARLAWSLSLPTVGRATTFPSSCSMNRLGRCAFSRNLRPAWLPSERGQSLACFPAWQWQRKSFLPEAGACSGTCNPSWSFCSKNLDITSVFHMRNRWYALSCYRNCAKVLYPNRQYALCQAIPWRSYWKVARLALVSILLYRTPPSKGAGLFQLLLSWIASSLRFGGHSAVFWSWSPFLWWLWSLLRVKPVPEAMNVFIQSFRKCCSWVGEGMVYFFLSLFAGAVRPASLHVRLLFEIIEALDVEVALVAAQGGAGHEHRLHLRLRQRGSVLGHGR